jgi:hypothetical protein
MIAAAGTTGGRCLGVRSRSGQVPADPGHPSLPMVISGGSPKMGDR